MIVGPDGQLLAGELFPHLLKDHPTVARYQVHQDRRRAITIKVVPGEARLIELDPRYCDVIVERWQGETGRSAVLETTGETFNALATETREEARVEDGAV
jgi:phenylacetate-CoA ligase